MPWNGTGTFSRSNGDKTGATTWQQDAAEPVGIEATRHDTHDQDIATALNNCITKDGQNEPTGHVPWIRKNWWGGTAGGTANARTVTLNPAPAAYAAGMRISSVIPATNTGTTTLNVNSLGAKDVKQPNGSALASGHMPAFAVFEYNGTDFILVNPLNNVALAGDQTVAGTKTFSNAVVLSTAGTTTSHAVRADREVASGTGLTGGGNLTANRTLALTGQALAVHNLSTNGLIARTASNTVAARSVAAGSGIAVTNGNGVSGNPTVAVDSTVIRTTGNQSLAGTKSFTDEANFGNFSTTGATNGKQINGTNWIFDSSRDAGDRLHYRFYNPNGLVGSISTLGTATTFATSSDYRLKNLIGSATGTLDKVKALAAILKDYTFKSEPDRQFTGFFAHEAKEIIPEAVTGEKDAVDEDGQIIPQGIDYAKLVPYLVGAIGEILEILEHKS